MERRMLMEMMNVPKSTTHNRFANGLQVFCKDVAHGFFEIAHNGLALAGLSAFVLGLALYAQPQLRLQGESALLGWLQQRQEAQQPKDLLIAAEPEAIDRATAADPADLPRQQAAVAYWLAKKYRVAPEPISALVAEAYEIGKTSKIEPTLILAIMAIESSFNPFAQSPVGAQGLMQVMTKIHTDKYDNFGGDLAAFDPVTNLKVGVKVLQECIKRAGSVEGGLRQYVGATSDATEGGYTAKVLAEQARLLSVAGGKSVPFVVPTNPATPVSVPTAAQPGQKPEAAEPAKEDKIAAL
jgi:hypothetical protein